MESHLSIVQNEPRLYQVFLKAGGHVSVKAECYTDTDYGWFAFYREDMEVVNRGYVKGNPPVPIYELPRRDVDSIAEEGVIEMHLEKRKAVKKKKKAIKKTKTKDISKDKQIIAKD